MEILKFAFTCSNQLAYIFTRTVQPSKETRIKISETINKTLKQTLAAKDIMRLNRETC